MKFRYLFFLISSVGAQAVALAQSVPTQYETTKYIPSDGQVVDEAGVAVALSGDVAVIGAHLANARGMDSGAAYIVRRSGNTWLEEQKLVASDGVAGDRFGSAVAITPGTIIVGAPFDDDRGSDSGSIYVFRFNGTTWVESQKIVASDGKPGDLFGNSVAVDGEHAIVGAYGNSDLANYAGAAYTFKLNGQSWIQGQKLLPVSATTAEAFGKSVSVSGIFAMVGAPQEDTKGNNAGAVYAYKYIGGSWSQPSKLTASDGGQYQVFGWAVRILGQTAVIGAPKDDDHGMMSGSSYVFRYNETNSQWSQEAKLTDPSGDDGDQFGHVVAISESHVIVAAPYWEDRTIEYPSTDEGAVYAYSYESSSNSWIVQTRMLAQDGYYFDNMGNSVAISGQSVLAGAAKEDARAQDSGSAFFFSLPVGAPTITLSSPPDGFIDPLEDRNASNQGVLYGIQNVSITFSGAVSSAGGSSLSAANFVTRCVRSNAAASDLQTGAEPVVTQVTGSGVGPYQLQLSQRICLGAWTEIKAVNVFGPGNVQIQGPGDKIVLGFLPMDITQDGKILGDDVNRWLSINNNAFDPAPLTRMLLLNQKRDGAVDGPDINRSIQLLNGIGTFQDWSGFDLGVRP